MLTPLQGIAAGTRPRLGPVAVALGGGAGLGWAHIGVVRALHQRGVRIRAAAGTSIGALVAACVATGKLDTLEDMARSTRGLALLRFFDLGWRSGGVLAGRTVVRELNRHFGEDRLEDLPIACAMVAADLATGAEVVIRSGPVVDAIRASIAIPGIFPPQRWETRLLADGGLVNPLPVSVARTLSDLPLIAVNLTGDYARRATTIGLADAARLPSPLQTARASIGLMLASLTDAQLRLAPPDILLNPDVGHINVADFTKAHELIEIGRATVEANWPRIAERVLPHPDLHKI